MTTAAEKGELPVNINTLKNFFLYCTLTREEFDSIRPEIWDRNRQTLRITSVFAAAMGLLFYLINKLSRSAVIFPYLFLLCGSLLISLSLQITRRMKNNTWISISLCYTEMLLLCVYAGILSTQQSNYAIPATSIIVFISLLPLSVDDRPVRMYAVMLLEAAGYLWVSFKLKSGSAFSLDFMNTITFCTVGMVLYGVICVRNVREIYQNARVERIQQSIISSLAAVVEERDENTGDHISRTSGYVQKLIAVMKSRDAYAHLSEDYCNNVILAAPMHDIGKIKISDAILNKPGRLTDEEFSLMKQHTTYGAEIIQKTMKGVEEEGYVTVACNIARHHHERFDGTGYPDGLKGEEIPLEARIMALADVYDALISERVYKKAFPKEKAVQIIKEGAGTQFDPNLVPLFLETVE